MLKNLLKTVSATSLLVAMSTTLAYADIQVNFDGQHVDISPAPVIIDGRTLVPARAIAEMLGGDVNWNGETRTVSIVQNDTYISLTIDSSTAIVNNADIELDVPAQIIDGNTIIPLRFVAENLGVDVQFTDNTVLITTGNNVVGEVQAGEITTGNNVAGEVQAGEITTGNNVAGEVQAGEIELQQEVSTHSLFSGTFTVGQDIPAGRYTITGNEAGNFIVYDNNDRLFVNEILNTAGDIAGDISFGVPSVTVDIQDGYSIEITGISDVTFTPVSNQLSNVLTTGHWIVGVHISAGQFDARPTINGDSGNFIIYSAAGRLVTNEILRERVRVQLQDGDVITISSLTSVTFE